METRNRRFTELVAGWFGFVLPGRGCQLDCEIRKHKLRTSAENKSVPLGTCFPQMLLKQRLILLALIIEAITMTESRAADVEITREASLSQHLVTPYVITGTPDNGYVVAGSSSVANAHGWATRLDSSGKAVWEYLDGPDGEWNVFPASGDSFRGAVLMPNDSVLLCGTKSYKTTRAGRLVMLDTQGHAQERDLYPNGDSRFVTGIQRCLKWSDGIAIIGVLNSVDQATQAPVASGWLVKMDLAGKVVWEKRVPFLTSLDVIELPSHELLVISWVFAKQGAAARVDKVDQAGNVVLTGEIPGGLAATIVRPVSSNSPITVITSDRESVTRVVQIDSSLTEVSKARVIERFDVKRAYFLNAQTTATFGGVERRGETAATGRLRHNDSLSVFLTGPLHESQWISDALQLERPGEFVSVRRANSRAIISWLNFGN